MYVILTVILIFFKFLAYSEQSFFFHNIVLAFVIA